MRFSFVQKIRQLGWVKLSVIGIVLFITAGGILASVTGDRTPDDGMSRTPLVKVASVRSLSAEKEALPVLGTVKSQSEATVQTEAQGQIVRVNYELGDFVSAGAVVAELSNSSERASVRQAQASLDNLRKSSVREESTARLDALNTYRNAFTLADNAVSNHADEFFNNARSSAPQITIGFFNINDISSRRGEINDLFNVWEQDLNSATTKSDLLPLLEQAESDLNFVKLFLIDLASLVNRQKISSELSQAALNTQKTSISTARTNVDSALANIAAAKNNLRSTEIGGGSNSEQLEEIAVAEAALSAARAALEKTIVRAPISGTINALDLDRGDFVSAFTPVVTIANNNALEVEAFITENDRADIAVGAEALIDGRYQGVVTRVAPTLDQVTKKIEIRIGIQSEGALLTNGESVKVLLSRSTASDSDTSSEQTEILIPVSALKVGADRIVVFTVSAENKLIAHPIVEGPLVGRDIIIEEGLTLDMIIVVDARGLNEGDVVEIAK